VRFSPGGTAPCESSLLHSLFAQTEKQKHAPWISCTVDAVLAAFHSAKASGLSAAAANADLETYGSNLLRSGITVRVEHAFEQFNSLQSGCWLLLRDLVVHRRIG